MASVTTAWTNLWHNQVANSRGIAKDRPPRWGSQSKNHCEGRVQSTSTSNEKYREERGGLSSRGRGAAPGPVLRILTPRGPPDACSILIISTIMLIIANGDTSLASMRATRVWEAHGRDQCVITLTTHGGACVINLTTLPDARNKTERFVRVRPPPRASPASMAIGPRPDYASSLRIASIYTLTYSPPN